MAPPIADALRRGAILVAANARAARVLHLEYGRDQCAAGHTVWPTPAIHEWHSWLRDLWREYAFSAPDAPMLLTPLQEQVLWTRAVRDDGIPDPAAESFAALAAEAWSLLSAYSAHAARRSAWASGDVSSDAQPDAERFRQWAAGFERDCTRHRWLSPSQLEAALTPPIASGRVTLPREVFLVGFDRVTPAQRALLEGLAAAGVGITEHRIEPDFSSLEAQRSWIAAADRSQEIAACASWARDLLVENAAARIGILVGGLAALRNPIDRILRTVLMPQSDDIRQPSVAMPYEFSLGQPLADVPAVRAALLLLRWIAVSLPQEEFSWLLLSGFISETVTIREAVAHHDARLRRDCLLSPERSLSQYRDSLTSAPALRRLQIHLSDLLRTVAANRILEAPRQPSAWTELVHTMLDAAGWPGLRPADSIQFQGLQRWQRLLDELALLDFDGTRCSYGDFLVQLDRHARATIFSAESHDAPIQILGPFESSGQQFDAVWFMGTDDSRWPLHGRLHPLLPPAVQREFEMPHSTPLDDWNLAHIVTSRVLASAPRVIFSFAEHDAETVFRPSPMVAGLFGPDAEPQHPVSLDADPSRVPHLETIADDTGVLPWPPEQNAGGASILTRQAACPFQSFAAKRLAAEPLDAVEWGLDPAEKGQLLHDVLRRIFSEPEPAPLRTRDDLVTSIVTNTLPSILNFHIDAAVRILVGPELADPWQRAWMAVEKQRLHDRLTEWLTLESKRQPFSVEACEQRLENVRVGDLRLNLRADRIDLLPDGTRLILDYKSGDVSAAAWNGDRPGEPQLPLYAAYGNVENLSGILLAKIRAGETGFDGRVRDAQAQLMAEMGDKKAIVTDPYSDAMRDAWARALENLAAEFLGGEAIVSPREPQVCGLCKRQSLCRVAELDRVAPNGDEDANGEDADA
jgi:probable DNA repair protein